LVNGYVKAWIMEAFEQKIFDKLGNLFYAIAKDQHVEAMEFGELKMIIRKHGVSEIEHPTAAVVSEPAHHIVLAMDALHAEGASADDAFQEFVNFYSAHDKQFSDTLKEKILATAEAITEVFPSGSRSKNNHIIKLRLLFQNSGLIR
jgi:hypothetical protein